MKVLLVNGSSNQHGCTFTALSEIEKSLNAEGIETELIQIGYQFLLEVLQRIEFLQVQQLTFE